MLKDDRERRRMTGRVDERQITLTDEKVTRKGGTVLKGDRQCGEASGRVEHCCKVTCRVEGWGGMAW